MMENKKVAFISGHRNLEQSEFDKYYVPEIQKYANLGYDFVVGDYYGCDIMAQTWISEHLDHNRVTVYHMLKSPRNLASKDFKQVGGFKTDIERDSAMTNASSVDIAFIRPGNWTSGTAQNILRRYEKLPKKKK